MRSSALRQRRGPSRGVLKAEVMAAGENPRFVGTPLETPTPQMLYEDLYCARGTCENAIKAVKCDLQSDLVDRLREKQDLTGLAPDEAAVVSYGREFFRTHQVSQATFDAARAQFGVRGLIELPNLMGYYALLAFNINAFGVGLPAASSEAPLPL